MKKSTLTGLLAILSLILSAQPANFTWSNRHNGYNYISPAKDQKEQGPCRIFASVGAVEAMTQIYFNKTQKLDLSESNIYSGGANCFGFGCNIGSASVTESLNFFITNGVVNETCFPFPTSAPWCRQDCQNICTNPTYKITIPGYQQLSISQDIQLKRNIIDNGPIIASLQNAGHILHPGTPSGVNHTVLVIGWRTNGGATEWYIKDSWPNSPGIYYKNINLFSYSPIFHYVKPVSGSNTIGCTGSSCSSITTRSYQDYDQDGFYNWGIGSKPAGCPGPDKMDFNDNDNTQIFLNTSYVPLPTPTISGPSSETVCESGGTFQLNNLPPGFTATWAVTPSANFNAPTSGTGTTATVYPKSTPIGTLCTITFTISDGTGTASYSKSFVINGPRTDQVSVFVENSGSGPAPMLISGVWIVCPNTTYHLYLNNSSTCSTSNYTWNLPPSWTKYYQSGNMVSINTNSSPSGTVEVYANTCCGNKKIKTQHFSVGSYCFSPLMVYPNPTSDEVTISLTDELEIKDKDILIEVFDSNYQIRFKTNKVEKEYRIKTSGWKSGIYFVRLIYKGNHYTSKITIQH